MPSDQSTSINLPPDWQRRTSQMTNCCWLHAAVHQCELISRCTAFSGRKPFSIIHQTSSCASLPSVRHCFYRTVSVDLLYAVNNKPQRKLQGIVINTIQVVCNEACVYRSIIFVLRDATPRSRLFILEHLAAYWLLTLLNITVHWYHRP